MNIRISIGLGLCLFSSHVLAAETGDKGIAKTSTSEVLAIGNAELAVVLVASALGKRIL